MKKNFLLGLITGCIIFSATSTFATSTYEALKATFPIFLNGEEWENNETAMVINGTTYLPLKSIGKLLDIDIEWNNDLNRVEITTENNEILEDTEEFSDDYWLNYYEEYYGKMFAELYGEDIETSNSTTENSITDADDTPESNIEEEVTISETLTEENSVGGASAENKNTTYVGNKNTKKLHLSTCAAAIKLLETNKVYFSSIDEAKGYTKCQLCNP